MKLKLVEIYGFKSFAHRTELSFDKGITGIVGPNGSGKSNIADAVRWVLGEQSAKLLRGAKMEDVIFSGTERRKALPYCEVSLLFDNADRTLNSQYSEVMVTRRVYRSGEGEYYLNKTACRLKDLLELFRDTGIGKEGYSIIGQGRIEEILSSRGDDRRRVFEEAAGIVTYRVRKEEAERKLQRTEENLLRLQDIIEELGARLEPLEEQAKTARAYLQLSKRLEDLDLNVFLVRHDNLTERINSLQTLTGQLQEAIQLKEAELRGLSASREQIEHELEALDTADRTAREAQEKAQKQVFDAQSNLQSEQNRSQALADELARKRADIDTMRERMQELAQRMSEADAGEQQHGQSEAQAAAALEAERQTLNRYAQEAERVEAQLDALKEQLVTALNKLGDTKASQARQLAMLEQAEKRQSEIANAITQAEHITQDAAARASDAERNKAAADRQLQALTEQEATLREQLDSAIREEEERAAEAQKLLMTLNAKRSRLQVLEDMAHDYEGYANAVKAALRMSETNPRVYGVVADIINVSKEYETAIEMILGGALQNVVTQDEETAKGIIDHLRANRLGRTTFLPVSAIRSRTLSQLERQLVHGPNVLGVASELVEFAPQFRGIVENLLGRTVIVHDLNTAIPLSRSARQAFHVVTLAGDVMRAGGAMTGGTSQSRASSLLGRRREMEELQQALDAGNSEIVRMQEKAKAHREQTAELQAQAQLLSERVNQQGIVAAREQERLQNAVREAEKALGELRALQDAATQLTETVDSIQHEFQRELETADHEQVDQKEMERQISALQEQLSQARARTEAQREKAAQLQEQALHMAHEADLLKRDRARFKKEQDALALQQERIVRDMETLEQRLGDSLATIDSARTLVDNAETALEACALNSREVAKQRSECLAKQRGNAQKTESAHAQHDLDSNKLHKNELVKARTENELQSLADYIFNTYALTYGNAQEHRWEGKLNLPKAELEIADLKREIREMGTVHVGAIEEYAATMERFQALETQRQDAGKAKDDLAELIQHLLSRMEYQFKQEFAKLSAFFAETFSRLFAGGKAELILTDPAAPLTCEIDILAQPPGKKLQLLSLLSGGERALTAIAILFAMLKLKPTPFCILDEIEAALDEANIGHFADYLSEYAVSTQFVVITHRKGTMERCDALYGVSMEEKGVSSMVSVDLQQYA